MGHLIKINGGTVSDQQVLDALIYNSSPVELIEFVEEMEKKINDIAWTTDLYDRLTKLWLDRHTAEVPSKRTEHLTTLPTKGIPEDLRRKSIYRM